MRFDGFDANSAVLGTSNTKSAPASASIAIRPGVKNSKAMVPYAVPPVISKAVVHHYGRDELLRRLAHPFWFQSFGALMGMDWHSSGITTNVIGALKRRLPQRR